MRIVVSRIPKDGHRMTFQEKVKPEGVTLEGPADVSVALRKIGRGVLVEGTVAARVRLECGDCLEPFVTQVSSEFSAEFRPSGEFSAEGEYELTGPELDVAYFEDDEIDLVELIGEQILLGLPIRPVCREGCKGLCPNCGANRNIEDCGCEATDVDPRFRILQSLKGESHGESDQ